MFFRLRVHYPEREGVPEPGGPPWMLELFLVEEVFKLCVPYRHMSTAIEDNAVIVMRGDTRKVLYVKAPILQVEQMLIWSRTYGEKGARPERVFEAEWIERGSEWKQ